MIKPARIKLPLAANNNLKLKLASFNRRFVEKEEIPMNSNKEKKDNKPLKEKIELVITNRK